MAEKEPQSLLQRRNKNTLENQKRNGERIRKT